MTNLIFQSTKTYTHSQGLSCCFRQWRATESHCSKLHGYALEVKVTFEGELDDRNWVQDFGGLKFLKAWLTEVFDHKTLVAQDDPQLRYYDDMAKAGIIDLVIVDAVGCEKFAEMIFKYIDDHLPNTNAQVQSVEVREHAGNSAIAIRKLDYTSIVNEANIILDAVSRHG